MFVKRKGELFVLIAKTVWWKNVDVMSVEKVLTFLFVLILT